MTTLNLRLLRTQKTVPVPINDGIGAPTSMLKSTISEKLQWQQVMKINGEFIECDWQDVPIVNYDEDEEQYV